MNQARAFCPGCKQDVVFQNTPAAAVCPACGASFELATEAVRRRRLSLRDGVLFTLWIFVPAVITLLLVAIAGIDPSDGLSLDRSEVLLVAGLLLGFLNSYCACSWLIGRFTQKLWPRVLGGVFLGLAVLSVNSFAAAFGGCVLAATGQLH